MNLITLLNDQPIGSLLPIRYLKPAEVLLVGRRQMHAVSQHLISLLHNETKLHLLEITDSDNPIGIYRRLRDTVAKLGWKDAVFNITGGTKMMAFGAYHLAHDMKSQLVHLAEWDKHRDILNRYHFEHGAAHLDEQITLPPLITLADYLNAHLPGFTVTNFSQDDHHHLTAGGRFEKTIYQYLETMVNEVLAGIRPKGVANQIEIDLMVRCGNRVGIIEAKTGVKKAGIDQLDTAGSEHYLGNHLAKILVTAGQLSRAYHALATSQQIHIVELPDYREGRGLSKQDKQKLTLSIRGALYCNQGAPHPKR